MSRIGHVGHERSRSGAAIVVALAVLAFASAALSGCDLASSGPLSSAPVAAPAVTPPSYPSAIPSDPTTVCPGCPSAGGNQVVPGQVTVKSGVQVLAVRVVGETYTPNLFNVKAGMPVRVTFTGNAVGCMKTPTFKSLGKSLVITNGTGSIDLGPLASGTYVWASDIGVSPGTIVAK